MKAGGKLADIRKRIEDRGLTVEGAISFTQWIVDDDARRAEALEQAKREMDILAQIGGKRIAAPPAGANGNNAPTLDLMKAAERYRALLELGDKMGVTPALELWGPSKNLHRLGRVHVRARRERPSEGVPARATSTTSIKAARISRASRWSVPPRCPCCT